MHLLPSWAPNVHPLIVHFPIVLVLLAVVVDVVQVLRPRDGAASLAVALFVLGAVSALVAFLSGWDAAGEVFTPGMAQALVADHRRWAIVTTSALVAVALLRIATHLSGRGRSRSARAVFLALSLALSVLVQQTAERGARLVYEQGVGVVAGPGRE